MNEGILPIDKPKGCTSFKLVALLRKKLGIRTIGHAGTLDPAATGVMILLVGRQYTKLSNRFLECDKEYLAKIHLGIETDSYDAEGQVVANSPYEPSFDEVKNALERFQGQTEQIPPMFSAKKQNGVKLYELARKNKTVERPPVRVNMLIELINYAYPYIELKVACSKGTYIRSLAFDMGKSLGCGAHLAELRRTKSGGFSIHECIDGSLINDPSFSLTPYLQKELNEKFFDTLV